MYGHKDWLRSVAALSGLALLAACGGSGSDDNTSPAAAAPATPPESIAAIQSVSGWAAQYPDPNDATKLLPPTGGEGAPATNIYVVTTRQELKDALANKGSPTFATNASAAALEPKIVYIKGTIYGTDLGNGQFATEASYVASVPSNNKCSQWNFEAYVKSFDTAYKANLQTRATGGDTAASAELTLINNQGSARTSCANVQKAQIQFSVPSNTTILGVGSDARIIDGYLELNARTNVIVRNLEIQAVQDWFMAWSPSDGATGNWNARYKAIQVVTGTRLWFDHLTLSDGSHPDSKEPVVFGKHIQRHDGLLDVEDGTDYVTVSYTVFKNHDKTFMIGSGDGKADKDRGKNRITLVGNLFDNSQERAPRVRFGKVHIYNNYFRASTTDPDYPVLSRAMTDGYHYFIGMGIESMILSESNSFDYAGTGASEHVIVDNFKGYQFKDVGSWFNGAALRPEVINKVASDRYEAVKAEAIAGWTASNKPVEDWAKQSFTNELGWTPPYSYLAGKTDKGIKQHVLDNAGAGKLAIVAPK